MICNFLVPYLLALLASANLQLAEEKNVNKGLNEQLHSIYVNQHTWERLEEADLTFSYTIHINSDKSIKTPLTLQPFVIEPDGKVREFGNYGDTVEEGLNTRFISISTPIDNPIKGNYVVGYLASFKEPVEGSVTFSGEVKAALSRPIKNEHETSRKIDFFVSEQPSVKGPIGRNIVSVSSDLEIF